MNKRDRRDVYQLFLEREGNVSMLVTSHRDTPEWLAVFDDVLLAKGAVDRFTKAAFDFIIEGGSHRPRLTPRLDARDATAPRSARAREPTP